MEVRRLIRFGTVGAATAVLYFGLLALFLHYWRMDYRFAVTIAYIISVGFHFLSNRRFTFDAQQHSAFVQLARYLILVGLSYVLTISIVAFVVERMKVDVMWAVAAAVAATTVIGFLASRYWIFRTGR